MKFFKVVFITLFFGSFSLFSQENRTKHIIEKGETISSIAQKYNVSIAAIYKLNPKAKKTLHLKQELIIPIENQKHNDARRETSVVATINHEVKSKETLYGITKLYKTSTEQLFKANPLLEKEGLKVGQLIVIPSGLTHNEISSQLPSNQDSSNEDVVLNTHQVKAKESMYAIAKLYGISLKDLQKINPQVGEKGLSVGQMISIPANVTALEKKTENEGLVAKEASLKTEELNDVVIESKVEEPAIVNSKTETSEVIHEVLVKETKYGIAKKYNITVAELEKQNPAIKSKLLVGSKLNIQVPNNTTINAKTEVTLVESVSETVSESSIRISNQELIEQLIQSASDKLGTRYRSGGTTIAGFDCSGLMCSTFGSFDIKLPRSSIEQAGIGEKIDTQNVQKGDLIFFKTNGRSRINHVGMVVEVADDEIKFIHSSTHNGVIISSTKEPYYKRNFAQVNRVIK